MDDTLRLIQYLYEEDVDDPDFARRVVEDDKLRRECERLQQTKEVLDRRSSPSPDPAVVDRIVNRASDAAQGVGSANHSPEPAPDRTAHAPDRVWSRRLQGASAAVVVLLLVGLGWWQLQMEPATSPTAASEQNAEAVTAGGNQGQEENIPEWDGRDEVVQLHRRIEMLQSRSRSDGWGTDLQTVDQARP